MTLRDGRRYARFARTLGRSLFATLLFFATLQTIAGALDTQRAAMVAALNPPPGVAVDGGPYNLRNIALHFAREEARRSIEASK